MTTPLAVALGTVKRLAIIVGLTALLVGIGYAAGYCNRPVDQRAAPWLAKEAAYRGRFAAMARDTLRLSQRVAQLERIGRQHYAAADSGMGSVIAGLDSLGTIACRDTIISLRPFADAMRYAKREYTKGHEADSLALLAAHQWITTLTIQNALGSALIAEARPIIHDAKEPTKGWRWFAAGVAATLVVVKLVH